MSVGAAGGMVRHGAVVYGVLTYGPCGTKDLISNGFNWMMLGSSPQNRLNGNVGRISMSH